MIKGIILAAGRGSRLGKLTDEKPKCLVTVKGESLLDRIITNFTKNSISDIGIIGGYKSNLLKPYTSNLFINQNWATTNMLSSLNCANPWLSKYECIISYSDIFYSAKIVNKLLNTKGDIVIAYDPNALKLWHNRFDNPLDDLEQFKIDTNGFITTIGGKAKKLEDIEGQYMGLLKITPNGWQQFKTTWNHLENNPSLDMTTLLNVALTLGTKMIGVANDDSWGEVDHPSDIMLYEEHKN